MTTLVRQLQQMNYMIIIIYIYMLWSNFILGFKLCFPLFQTHYHTDYHTQKQRKIKTETKDKIELQICIQLSKLVQALQILLMSGVTVTSASQVLESCWKIWSQVSQRKKPFSDFPVRGPGMYNYRDGYTE